MAKEEKQVELENKEVKAKKKSKSIIKDEANNNRITTKARYWTAVGYVENMRDDWQEVIGSLLQYPYVYCVHDKDKQGDGDDRKVHVHIVVAYGNTTTYKSALALFRRLNKEGCEAFNTCEPVANIRYIYDYLIHDTEDSKKKGKYRYDKSARIAGNNFDIGSFEQLSVADKERMAEELEDFIIEYNITNYRSLYLSVKNNFDKEYKKILRTYSSHFERLLKGNYQCKSKDCEEQEKVITKEDIEQKKFDDFCARLDKHHKRWFATKDGFVSVCDKDSCEGCPDKDYCGFVNGFDEFEHDEV